MNAKMLKIFHSLHPNGRAFKYQVEWAMDDSNYKLGVKARQIGMTYSQAVKEFLDGLFWKESKEHPSPLTTIFCSPSQRQSERLMTYLMQARSIFERLYETKIVFKKEQEERVIFDNHCEIFSLPNNPRTIEGNPCSRVIIDEAGNFARHDGEAVYASSLASTGAQGGGISVVGVPKGRAGILWTLADPYGDYTGKFSRYEFKWHLRAEEDPKYKKTVLEHKERMSPSAFASNYECEFTDESVMIFPYEMLKPQVSSYPMWTLQTPIPRDEPIYIGIDFGKKVSQTAITAVSHDGKRTRVMFHEVTGADFDVQIRMIEDIIKHFNPIKVLVDQGGLGAPMLDILSVKYAGVVEGVIPSLATKERIVLNCRNIIQSGQLTLPDIPELIEQLQGFEKEITEMGNVRYTGKRTETDWLDDRAYSLFLACSQLSDGEWSFTVSEPIKEIRVDAHEQWRRE